MRKLRRAKVAPTRGYCFVAWAILTAAVVMAALSLRASSPAPEYDVILRHGTIYDGGGDKPYSANVAILHGHIAQIGNLARAHARTEIDATGLYIAPGFLNIHSHAVPAALPTAVNMLLQGVTTEIINADGQGSTDISDQLSKFASAGLAVNLGAYVGFNTVWQSVMGQEDHRATPEDIEKMKALVEANLARGAFGLSAGLDYKPGYFATTEEAIAVASAARKWRTNFPNHERIRPETGYSSIEGIKETIQIAEAAGLSPEITHIKAQGPDKGRAADILALMRQATARGHYTPADVYPYLAGQTGLGALLIPGWAQNGGRDAMLKRFADPAQRAKIATEAEEALRVRFMGPEGVLLPQTKKRLSDLMREENASAGETLIRVLEKGSPSAILQFGLESDLVQFLEFPEAAIACDCGSNMATAIHPRYYGAFPRVLGHYVRETHLLTWEQAIRKMTGLPASIVGMVDRGFLAPGMAADVSVFDPTTIADRSTYEDPAQPPVGVRYVLVNGVVEVSDGKPTGEKAGVVLARSEHMPTRPVRTAEDREASARGTLAVEGAVGTDITKSSRGVKIEFHLAQSAGATGSVGRFRLLDPDKNIHLDTQNLGMLQIVPEGWASFTGWGEVRRGGPESAFTVILDASDPRAPDPHAPRIIVDVPGIYNVSGTIPPKSAKISP